MRQQKQSRTAPIRARWKINSNGYGGRILAAIGICVLVLPIGCLLVAGGLDRLGIKSSVPILLMRISLTVGAVLAGLFVLLLVIELLQDRALNRYYVKNKKHKVQLTGGDYECQYCGARNIRATDKQCPFCGTEFQIE